MGITARVGWVVTKLRDSLRVKPREESSEHRDTLRSLVMGILRQPILLAVEARSILRQGL